MLSGKHIRHLLRPVPLAWTRAKPNSFTFLFRQHFGHSTSKMAAFESQGVRIAVEGCVSLSIMCLYQLLMMNFN